MPRGIRGVMICGIRADGCAEATALTLRQGGFACIAATGEPLAR